MASRQPVNAALVQGQTDNPELASKDSEIEAIVRRMKADAAKIRLEDREMHKEFIRNRVAGLRQSKVKAMAHHYRGLEGLPAHISEQVCEKLANDNDYCADMDYDGEGDPITTHLDGVSCSFVASRPELIKFLCDRSWRAGIKDGDRSHKHTSVLEDLESTDEAQDNVGPDQYSEKDPLGAPASVPNSRTTTTQSLETKGTIASAQESNSLVAKKSCSLWSVEEDATLLKEMTDEHRSKQDSISKVIELLPHRSERGVRDRWERWKRGQVGETRTSRTSGRNVTSEPQTSVPEAQDGRQGQTVTGASQASPSPSLYRKKLRPRPNNEAESRPPKRQNILSWTEEEHEAAWRLTKTVTRNWSRSDWDTLAKQMPGPRTRTGRALETYYSKHIKFSFNGYKTRDTGRTLRSQAKASGGF